jgi:hypothetical protein
LKKEKIMNTENTQGNKFDFERAVALSTAKVTQNGDVTFVPNGLGRAITVRAGNLKFEVSATLSRSTGHPCLDEETMIIGFPDAITLDRYLELWGLAQMPEATA